MKNTFKARIVPFFGIIALLAVIGFVSLSLTGCDDGTVKTGGDNDKTDGNDGGDKTPPPIELKLFDERWGVEGGDGGNGENWTSKEIKLSDYTSLKPKRGEIYTFNISGNSDKELKYVQLQLFQKPGGVFKNISYSTYRHNLNTSFTNRSFKIVIYDYDIDTRYEVYLQVVNLLWQKDKNGNHLYEEIGSLPDNAAGDKTTLMATISNFTMTVSTKPPEELTDEERWSSWQDPDSTASLDHFSIDSDSTVKVTVGGTPEQQGDGVWNAWKVNVMYSYTTKTDTRYTYTFKARTESGTRKLHVEYYNDYPNETYLGGDIDLTSSWQTFTIKGQPIPKARVEVVMFQCANVIGTVYVKMISIAETVSGGDISDFVYSEENGKITITRYVGDGGAVTIPASINGKPVTAIGDEAFKECSDLTSVIIPNGVTSIGNNAFSECWNLTSVTIPNTVTSIGYWAFAWNGRLASITIPNSVTSIGDNAFAGCSGLPAINVNSNNANYSSENGVLYNRNKTTLVAYPAGKAGSFTVPDNITSIEDCAFARCEKLTGIIVNAANNAYSSEDGVLYNKTKTTLVAYPAGKADSFTIPNGVTTIGRSAFDRCSGLTNVTIPNTVTSIEWDAFSSCWNLTSVTIPNSVNSFGWNAFGWCSNLISVTFEGTIPRRDEFNNEVFAHDAFHGDLRDKFYATDPDNGTPGTYTTTAPVGEYSVWVKQ